MVCCFSRDYGYCSDGKGHEQLVHVGEVSHMYHFHMNEKEGTKNDTM